MCTRANRASVRDSLHALVGSSIGVATALLALVVAMATAPCRLVRHTGAHRWSPASTAHVTVQVHLEDRKRVGEIERGCRSALRRAARTWAHHPLPLDRVEVVSSAPALGKTDIYERWVVSPDGKTAHSLVVVSVGTLDGKRPLTADEIAGAVAGQIELLVIDRYRREHAHEQASASTVGDLAGKPEARLHPVAETSAPAANRHPPGNNVSELSSYRELLENMKRSRPLEPVGSSQDGVHPEPNPA
jgi:hypothetical protein